MKLKINEGEAQDCFIENSHPAIVSTELFDFVQHEIKKRKNAMIKTQSNFMN